MENKRLIIGYFIRTLQLTRAGEDIEAIELSEDQNTETIIFRNGYKKPVDITADSGIAMIKDIAKSIG